MNEWMESCFFLGFCSSHLQHDIWVYSEPLGKKWYPLKGLSGCQYLDTTQSLFCCSRSSPCLSISPCLSDSASVSSLTLCLSAHPPRVLGLFYSETMCSCGYRSWNNAITSWVTIPLADHEWTAWCKPCQWEGCPERPVLLPVCILLETSAEAVAFWGFSKSILQANFKYNFQNGFEG